MVEGAGLENQCSRKATGGSNPSLSATNFQFVAESHVPERSEWFMAECIVKKFVSMYHSLTMYPRQTSGSWASKL